MNIIDHILTEWNKDCIIDDTHLSREILNIPKLHCKYLSLYSDYRGKSNKIKFEYDKMKHLRTEYYSGHLDRETLKELNWEEFDLHLSTKTAIEKYLAADEILIKIQQKRVIYDQAIEILESILGELRSRSYQLKSIIEYEKFKAGA